MVVATPGWGQGWVFKPVVATGCKPQRKMHELGNYTHDVANMSSEVDLVVYPLQKPRKLTSRWTTLVKHELRVNIRTQGRKFMGSSSFF